MKSDESAFTLLEVLVALAVLATTLTAGYLTTRSATTTMDYLYDRLLGHWAVTNTRTLVQLGEIDAGDKPLQFDTVLLGRRYMVEVVEANHDERSADQADDEAPRYAEIHVNAAAHGAEVAAVRFWQSL